MNVWRLWIVDTQKVQNISTYPTFDLLAHIVHITSGLVVCRSRGAWLCAALAWCRPPGPLPALTPAPAPAAWAPTPAPPPAGSGTAAGWRSPLQQETQALYLTWQSSSCMLDQNDSYLYCLMLGVEGRKYSWSQYLYQKSLQWSTFKS